MRSDEQPHSINDFLQKGQRDGMFHSSGYGVAQSGDGMGAAALASFEARKALEAKRKYIGGYSRAQLNQNQNRVQQIRRHGGSWEQRKTEEKGMTDKGYGGYGDRRFGGDTGQPRPTQQTQSKYGYAATVQKLENRKKGV